MNRERLPIFRVNKRYSEMTKNQKLEYKRWLCKHDMWDSEVVIENLENKGVLNK